MTLTPDNIYQRLQKEDVTLAFDTSVTTQSGFLQLCDQANRINIKRRANNNPKQIKLCVPAAAHTERLFDLAQEKEEAYNIAIIRQILSERNVKTPSFTIADAEHCAQLLHQRYATPQKWHNFKKKRCLECVGLPVDFKVEGSGKRCGAPNDWLIIAQASRSNMILVMDDKGRSGEFDLLQNVARYKDIRQVLDQILKTLI